MKSSFEPITPRSQFKFATYASQQEAAERQLLRTVQQLEDDIQQLTEKNSALKAENYTLQAEISALQTPSDRTDLELLKSQVRQAVNLIKGLQVQVRECSKPAERRPLKKKKSTMLPSSRSFATLKTKTAAPSKVRSPDNRLEMLMEALVRQQAHLKKRINNLEHNLN